MSIKAMNWAMSQATGDPRAQCLLYVIADCANEEGIAWPSADWMAEKSQQSRATVYRRLDALQALGALVMFPRWIDENGKISGSAAPGRRRTSPEIRLQLGISIKRAAAEDDGENEQQPDAPQSQAETTPSRSSDSPISQQRRGSSHCSDNNHHLNQEDSPQPPSGGSEPSASLDGWKDFERDWVEPILRQSIAQQIWAALKADERSLARQAARGYVLWRRSQKKPPNVLGAHLFLRERDAWQRFAKMAQDGTQPASGIFLADSIEAKAVQVLHDIAGRSSAFWKIWRRPDGSVNFRKPMTDQLRALAQAPEPTEWVTLDRNGGGAWEALMREFFGPEETRARFAEGSRAPWAFPPSQTGKIYTAADPPTSLMTEDDMANFTS